MPSVRLIRNVSLSDISLEPSAEQCKVYQEVISIEITSFFIDVAKCHQL